MFAKSTVYDKLQWEAENPAAGPLLRFNFGSRQYDVSPYRYIRVDWENERVAGSNTDTPDDWRPLPALDTTVRPAP